MTVSVETNKSQLLVYASGTDQYSWGTFEIPTEDDLRAYVFDDSGNGDATLLTLTTHYTVDTANKRIELTTAGHSFISGLGYTNERIAIYRSIDALTQTNEYTNQGAFLSQTIEDSFDQIYYVLQEHSEILKRTLQIDPFDTVVDGYATEEEQRQAVTCQASMVWMAASFISTARFSNSFCRATAPSQISTRSPLSPTAS